MHDICVYKIQTYEIIDFAWIWNEPMKPINLWYDKMSRLDKKNLAIFIKNVILFCSSWLNVPID
jgi:hypothetical protein